METFLVGRTPRVSIIALGFVVCAGCSLSGSEEGGASPDPAGDPAETGAPQIGRETRLDAWMDRVDFAFQERGGRFEAGYSTHRAAVEDGVLRVTPHGAGDRVVTGPALALETAAIRCGGAPIDTTYRGAAVDGGSGRLRLARADVTEELRNDERGVEQSWRFESAPCAGGDLVVEVAVSGPGYLSSTDGGLHFGAPGQLGFRYSHATWIDAHGADVPIAAVYADGRIRMTVPSDVLSAARFPAVLDPIVRPESAVDEPVVGWTGAGARRPSVASSPSGHQFLVVWQDDRGGAQRGIAGARVSAEGELLDPLGIAVSDDGGVQDNPSVTFAGGVYVIAWEEAGNIRAATVEPGSGTIRQLGHVVATAANEVLPRLASRGATALLVYQSDEDVRAAVFSGRSFGEPFNVAASAAVEREPAVAGDPGGRFLVTFTQGTEAPDLRARFVTAGGVASGASFDISAAPGAQSQSDAAFVGGNFAVVWANNEGGIDVYGTRVSPTGAVLDTRSVDEATVGGIRLVSAASSQTQPELACRGSACLVTWTDRRDFAASGFDIYGQALGPDLVGAGAEVAIAVAVRDQRAPSVAAGASGWLASWHDDRHGGPDAVLAARIDAAGALVDPDGILVVSGQNQESSPAVVENGARWLVAWSDSRELGADLHGARVRYNGVLDSAGGLVTAPGQQGAPDAARLGTGSVLVWSDARDGEEDIYAARVDADGNSIDGGGIRLTTAAREQVTPEVASDSAGSLVVWQDRRNGDFDIFGAVLSPDGAVTATDIPICVGEGNQTRPSVAFDGASGLYLVAWSSQEVGLEADLFGARVAPGGAVLDPCGVAISAAPGAQSNPDVTAAGGQFLVTWEDRRADDLGDVFGARVDASAGITIIDPDGVAIAAVEGSQTEPVAVFGWQTYLVAWTDGRDAGLSSTDIHGATFSTEGAVETSFVISATPEAESSPAVSANQGASSDVKLVAYSRRVSGLSTSRVFHRLILAGSDTCSSDAACDSGFCVDGQCCDSACGGSDTNDCQACSIARGADQDGVCGPVAAGRVCRGYANPFCDQLERCDGTGIACPEDLGRRQGQVCSEETGAVCPVNDVTGAPHLCPLPTGR